MKDTSFLLKKTPKTRKINFNFRVLRCLSSDTNWCLRVEVSEEFTVVNFLKELNKNILNSLILIKSVFFYRVESNHFENDNDY